MIIFNLSPGDRPKTQMGDPNGRPKWEDQGLLTQSMSSNPNNANKRPSGSDTDEFEPSKADKKKSRKAQRKPPGQGKSHQPDPTLSGSEYEYKDYETENDESEGEMDVVNTERVDYDNSPFLIDLTDDKRKFWGSETEVMVGLQ